MHRYSVSLIFWVGLGLAREGVFWSSSRIAEFLIRCTSAYNSAPSRHNPTYCEYSYLNICALVTDSSIIIWN